MYDKDRNSITGYEGSEIRSVMPGESEKGRIEATETGPRGKKIYYKYE